MCAAEELLDGEKAAAPSVGGREDLLRFIEGSQVGFAAPILTEFGERKLTFADYTASGRALAGIEDFIRSEVLPLYANTHSTASTTGMQTTLFRAEARDIVRRGVGADNNLDAVLFTGTGCTGAVGKMLDLLRGTSRWRSAVESGTPPVVLVGPYEHHSNLLPWRESGALVLEVREGEDGGVDYGHLEELLVAHAPRMVVGTFSAASNVTGVLTDTVAVATRLHRHGALAFFDFATAGPYCKVEMNPTGEGIDASLAYKDGVFLSPHKFVGGVCTPGVLAFKRSLLERGVALGAGAVPCLPGGGTVFYVSEWGHRYLENLEEREEGGTPDIVGAIRCGLAFRVKEAVGPACILAQAARHWATALETLRAVPNLHLLGNLKAARLPIVSFNVRHGGLLLHHNFVAALLNDLFGIQVRAGCACAGPYAQRCMGINRRLSGLLEAALLQGDELLRPGFVRLNLPYFAREDQVRFVLDAVMFVANHGWKLLPLYAFLPATGEWRHRSAKRVALRQRRWLSHVTFHDGAIQLPAVPGGPSGPRDVAGSGGEGGVARGGFSQEEMGEYLAVAMREAEGVVAAVSAGKAVKGGSLMVTEQALEAEGSGLSSPEAQSLRWFVLPHQALREMSNPLSAAPVPEQAPEGVMERLSNAADAGAGGDGDGADHSAFERFARGELLALLKRQPHASFSDILVIAGEKWRGLSASERERFAHEPVVEHYSNGAPPQQHAPPSSARTPAAAQAPAAAAQDSLAAVADKAEVPPQGVIDEAPRGRAPSAEAVCAMKKPAGARGNGEAGLATGGGAETGVGAGNVRPAGIDKKRVQKAEKKLMHLVGKAILDFGMIKHGDRVMVGLSGGKDSLSMLHLLLALQKKAPISFDVGACTVDPQTPEYDPSVLIDYLKGLGVPYFYESQAIIAQASCSMTPGKVSICAFCARMKRGILYSVCVREGYTALALGQHLDDQAESLLMSAFHNGQLRTMKAHYVAEHGVRVIRPLNYCREQQTREYAAAAALPVISETCPACYEAPKERARIKMVLAAQEQLHPDLHSKLLNAMLPLMALECADGEAPILEHLLSSKHTGESAIAKWAVEAAAPLVPAAARNLSAAEQLAPARGVRLPRQAIAGGKVVAAGKVVAEKAPRATPATVQAAAAPVPEPPSPPPPLPTAPPGVTPPVAGAALAGLVGLAAGLLLPAMVRAMRA